MKKRVHKVANFLAFNLLFFALYLNFIYKDPAVAPAPSKAQAEPAAFSGALTDDKPVADKSVMESPAKTSETAPAKTAH